MTIVIFIHAAAIGKYKQRLREYMAKFKESGLYDEVKAIYINYVGPIGDVSIFDGDDKVIYQQVSENLADYELPTHSALYNFCKIHPNYKVLYLHTKGIHQEPNQCIEDWVEYMSYFCINKWRVCVDKLNTYRTVGVDLRDYPTLHYSGNFWWATSEHIASLVEPYDFSNLQKYPNAFNSFRHNHEFWLAYDKQREKYCCLWESNISSFERHLHLYPRSAYSKEL